MEVCDSLTCGSLTSGDSNPPAPVVHRVRNWVGIRTSLDAGTKTENIIFGKQTAFIYPAAFGARVTEIQVQEISATWNFT